MDRRRVVGSFLGTAAALLLVGCGGMVSNTPNKQAEERAKKEEEARRKGAVSAVASGESVNILCSFFPVYLFTKNVVGDAPGATVSLMLPASKGCPHGYDLTPGDGKRIAEAKIVVLNGGGLEEFDAAKIRRFNANAIVIDSTKTLALAESDCCDDDDHDHDKDGKDKDAKGHDHEKGKEEHHHHEGGKNPHAFTSPFMAAKQVKAIGEELASADLSRAETYRKNAAAYAAKLEAVGKEMKDALANAKGAKVVTSHEIFDYLANDLGFKVVGEVQTGSGSEQSPRKLIDTIKKEGAKAIFTEPQFSAKKAEQIAKEAGVPTFELDPIASGPDDASLDHYEKTMRANIAVLKKALGG